MVFQQSYSPVRCIDSETTYRRRGGGPRAGRNRHAAAMLPCTKTKVPLPRTFAFVPVMKEGEIVMAAQRGGAARSDELDVVDALMDGEVIAADETRLPVFRHLLLRTREPAYHQAVRPHDGAAHPRRGGEDQAVSTENDASSRTCRRRHRPPRPEHTKPLRIWRGPRPADPHPIADHRSR